MSGSLQQIQDIPSPPAIDVVHLLFAKRCSFVCPFKLNALYFWIVISSTQQHSREIFCMPCLCGTQDGMALDSIFSQSPWSSSSFMFPILLEWCACNPYMGKLSLISIDVNLCAQVKRCISRFLSQIIFAWAFSYTIHSRPALESTHCFSRY